MVKIIETLIPNNTNARPGTRRRKFTGVSIHETGNTKPGAGAKNHSDYKTVNGGWNAEESYHYVVDSKEGYRLLPENEIGWHAGDGFNGAGNNETVAIEICVNPDSDFNIACKNAAEITADILKRNGIRKASGYVFQHNNWSGKNCPQTIRATNKWGEFVSNVQKAIDGTTITPPTTPSNGNIYRVRKSWNEASSQINAYSILDNAKKCADENKGYSVFDTNGNAIYPVASSGTPSTDVKYVNLFAVRTSWAVYDLNAAPVTANAKGHLNPKKFGGLSYEIVKSLGGNMYVINTSSFGQVKIYCVNDSEGNVDTKARYAVTGGASTPAPAPTPAPSGDKEIKRYAEKGVCTTNVSSIIFRDAPSTSSTNLGSYYKNETVNYDLVVITEKYTWISWIGRSTNVRRYMPITDRTTSERWASCK